MVALRPRRATAGMFAAGLLVAPLGVSATPTTASMLGLPALRAPPAARVELGRALFFERRLSVNGTLSCAMCHLPAQGFTSNELRTSVGMEGVSLRRNAPTLLNVAHVPALFHDGRVGSLEAQALMPVLHPDEMANPDLRAVLVRVAGWKEYRPLFRRAFGTVKASATRIGQALAAYQRSLVAGGSRFDRWRYGGETAALDQQERRGFEIFGAQGCGVCHPVGAQHALFTDQGFHNVGVQARSDALRQRDLSVELMPTLRATLTPVEVGRIGVPDSADLGRQEVTRRAADARAFRTPSLRNVALTAPYMHDGSFATLQQVVDHYASGGWPADPAQDARIRPLTLDPSERAALVAFLRSLTSEHVPGVNDRPLPP